MFESSHSLGAPILILFHHVHPTSVVLSILEFSKQRQGCLVYHGAEVRHLTVGSRFLQFCLEATTDLRVFVLELNHCPSFLC